MSLKVCKFGGTAMADAKIISSVKDIIESDSSRRLIVVSAPGKRFAGDKKVTDLLLECHKELLKTGTCGKSFSAVRSRFFDIAKQLKLSLDIDSVLDTVFYGIEKEKSEQFTASRGEYLCGMVMAEYLEFDFVDAANVIYFNNDGTLNNEKTYKAVVSAINKTDKAVISGFYGVDERGKVRTFSRGGSDITGAVIACAVNADLYENWTDVSGFLACDPNIGDNPDTIDKLSYRELRELSYMGARVLHSESVFPVSKANIPVLIKNTFRPQDKGTTIAPATQCKAEGLTVSGIAGKKNFTVIDIEKQIINSDINLISKVLASFDNENIAVERISTDTDRISIIIKNDGCSKQKLDRLIEGIQRKIKPENISVKENIALIATVGRGKYFLSKIGKRIFKTVLSADIDLIKADMPSDGTEITIAVNNQDYERCIKALYCEFFE